MYITKRLIDLMGGSVHVESEPGKGSVFTMRIPQKRIGKDICGAELTENLRNLHFRNTASITKKIRFSREFMPYGHVLVVDDVASNLYVSKGLLLPYGLQIETVSSGFDAIERVKNGKVYDIIFMDHMMPKLDGIETAKILRDMGYSHSIVALTADALAGKAEMFLQNGFDGYISKPIDSRELNAALNELIRNKTPAEVVEAARQEQAKQNDKAQPAEAAEQPAAKKPAISKSRLTKFFVMDAENALRTLDNMFTAPQKPEGEGLAAYITTVHGMKSALANMGETALSGFAAKLEMAGKKRDYGVISDETPAFMNELRDLIIKLKPKRENNDAALPDEDRTYLLNKLTEIKTASLAFDKEAVKVSLQELKQKTWPDSINVVLDNITVHLLHSAFKKAAAEAEELAKGVGVK
jgi:CheY-like chemotaxis protein